MRMKDMNQQRYKYKKGFTLMELLIVIVLLGFLITVGLTSFRSAQTKSKDSRRKSNLEQIGLALEAYHNDFGQYPDDNASGQIMGCGVGGVTVCSWDAEWSDSTSGVIYMVKLAADPDSGYSYYYDGNATGVSYQLYARLRNDQDIDIPTSGSTNQAYSGTTCGGGELCNYAVTSSNVSPETNHALVND